MAEVVTIHLGQRLAFLSDGREWPIIQLIDRLGAETENTDEAVSFVCSDGKEWISAPISDFERATIH